MKHISKARKTSNPICSASGALLEEWPARSGRWNDAEEAVSACESADRIYLPFVATFPKFFRNVSAVLQECGSSGILTQTTE